MANSETTKNQGSTAMANDAKSGADQGNAPATDSRKQIVLSEPAANQNQIVSVSPGLDMQADFDMSNVLIGRSGRSIVLQFDEGGSITLKNITALANNDQAPAIILPDGSELSTGQLLSYVTSTNNKVEPAAGPDQKGGGVGEYQDNPGDILEGVAKLDGLDFATAATGDEPPIDSPYTPLDAEGADFDISIRLDSEITPDDNITAAEAGQQITITGTVGQDVNDGDIVTLTINGNTYSGPASNGGFSIEVPGSDLANDPNLEIEASVTSVAPNGNSFTATDTETYTTGEVPVAVDDTITTAEDTPVNSSVSLHSNDTDPDGDPLSLSSGSVGTFTTAQGGTIVVAADGSYTYTPPANFFGDDTFDYTVTDGQTTDTGTLNITVTPVNDAPDASPDGVYDAVEGTPMTIGSAEGVLTNDTDMEGDTLTASQFATDSSGANAQAVNGSNSVTTKLGGTVVLNADGSFQYTAPANLDHSSADVLTDTFYYQASDGQATSSWTQVEFAVRDAANDATPDGVYNTVEGSSLAVGSAEGVLTNDTNMGSDPLTASQFATDSSGANAQAVNGTNTVTTMLGGTVVLNADGSFEYVAPASLDHSAADTLTDAFYYQASNGQATSSWTRVEIAVGDTAPIAGNIDHTLPAGREITGDMAIDADNGSGGIVFGPDGGHIQSITIGGVTHTYDAANPEISIATPNGGTLAVNFDTGAYTYNVPPGAALQGDDVFSVVGVDGDGDTAAMTLTVHSHLEAHHDTVLTNVAPGETIEIPDEVLLYNDNGNNLSVNQVADPVNGTVVQGPGQVNFTMTGNGLSDTAVVSIVNETEPNNTPGAAVDLSDRGLFGRINNDNLEIDREGYTAAVRGRLDNGPDRDTDYIKVSLQEGENLFIDMNYADRPINGYIEYEDENGDWQTLDLSQGCNDCGIADDFQAPRDGDYFIRLETEFVCDSDYELLLTITEDSVQNHASFNYDASDGQATDTAGVDIYYANNSTLNGEDSDEKLVGGGNDDTLNGNGGHDAMAGNGGNDILVGGEGNDLLIGGDGSDTFSFSANGNEGRDTIKDFDVATDTIRLSDVLDVNADGPDLNDLVAAGQEVAVNVRNADVELSISNGGETTVVTMSGINAGGAFDGDTTLTDLINHGLNVEYM